MDQNETLDTIDLDTIDLDFEDHEDDGQPSMYEEYQDLWDGDDNFLDWAAEDY